MADVALVPEGDVFHRRDCIPADHTGEAAETFAGDRVALVRHRRTAFLPLGEILLHLEHLGALEVAELGGPAVDRTRCQCEHSHELGMPVALHDLRGQRGRFQPELVADLFFDTRIEMRAGSDGAAQLAHRHARAHLHQAFAQAAEFVIHESHLEPERDGLRVDAMAASHHRRHFVRPGLSGHGGTRVIDAFHQQVASRRHLHGERGVEDVGRSQPLMHPARGRADGGSHIFEEGDDIVVGALFDFEDLRNGELRLLADGAGIFNGDLAKASHGLAGQGLDLEPNLVFALVGPKCPHLRPGISFNHDASITSDPAATNPECRKGRQPCGRGPCPP